ncbi:MAG: S8 family serine peptidase [Acidobacteria bacterium]|nr:S8 family serine peptidase [Acidobacteriota bacterium]
MTIERLPGPGILRQDELRPRTGRGIRIAVIDSGVHATHPHVGGIAGGVGIDPEGGCHDDFVDRLGHGTAVTAAIREKAPDAELWAVRIFDRELAASSTALVAGIDWALRRACHLVNLSLGTSNVVHEHLLRAAVARARADGVWIVAAGEQGGVRWLPGTLDGGVSVTLDWEQPRETCIIDETPDPAGTGATTFRARASGWPRPIPGVPPERNLKGLSFAVANVTGLLALVMQPAD